MRDLRVLHPANRGHVDTVENSHGVQSMHCELHGIKIACCSCEGNKWGNEDSYCVADLGSVMSAESEASDEFMKSILLGVFDGHCGHRASQFVASELPYALADTFGPGSVCRDHLSSGFRTVDEAFCARFPHDDEHVVMDGSTATVSLIAEASAFSWTLTVCQLGDSAAFVLHPDGSVTSLTSPQTPLTDRERLSSLGASVDVCREKWALVGRLHPMRPYMRPLSVSRAFGAQPCRPEVCADPVITEALLNCDDVLVLCTDGLLTKSLSALGRRIKDMAVGGLDLEEIANSLASEAAEIGEDNVTVVLATQDFRPLQEREHKFIGRIRRLVPKL